MVTMIGSPAPLSWPNRHSPAKSGMTRRDVDGIPMSSGVHAESFRTRANPADRKALEGANMASVSFLT